jgi:hypothetical protein
VPGIILGLAVALTLNVAIRFLLFSISSNALGYGLSPTSLYIGITFGVVMPMISILLPIKSALSKNLRSSLDLNHRSNNEKSVEL